MSKRKPAESENEGAAEADAPSEGFPVEFEPDPLAVAVDLLKRCHGHVGHDMLAQQVYAFVKAHGG